MSENFSDNKISDKNPEIQKSKNLTEISVTKIFRRFPELDQKLNGSERMDQN